jgi:hypothetical protein
MRFEAKRPLVLFNCCTNRGHEAASFDTQACEPGHPGFRELAVNIVDFHNVYRDLTHFCLLQLAVLVPLSPISTKHASLRMQ